MTTAHAHTEDDQVPDPLDSPAAERRSAVRASLARWGAQAAYLAPTFPISLAAFLLSWTLALTGAALVIVWVGLAILVAALLCARGFATLERVRLRALRGEPIPRHLYPAAPPEAGRVRRLLWPARQPQSWLDLAWTLVGFVTGTLAWTLTLVWFALAVGGLTFWLWARALPEEPSGIATLLGFPGLGPETLVNAATGILATVTLPLILGLATWIHAAPASALLNSFGTLREERDAERHARHAHQDAEAHALRRLERDLHDGPQQRLVRLGMDLGRASKHLDTDPERAAALLESARTQARDTVAELRALTRGIAPPLLTDRGLRVALDDLTSRAGVPATLTYSVAEDLDPIAETAAYFTVSEALTNVAKHAGASRVAVSVHRVGGGVEVRVDDDGRGGAHEGKGAGLRGLRDRVEGLGGTLVVSSPDGGPTTVTAFLPTAGDPH